MVGDESSSVSVSLETKPQLQDVIVELTSETVLPRVLPLSAHYLEPNVLQYDRQTDRQTDRQM